MTPKMTLFVDQLTVMDFSYVDNVRGLVGESWIVDVSLDGDLDAQGMIFDFGHVKKQLKAEIDQLLDHKLIIPIQMPSLVIEKIDHSTRITWKNKQGLEYTHMSPNSAIAYLDTQAVTTECAARYLEAHLLASLPNNTDNLRISLNPEITTEITPTVNYYHYSHGLKKHQGDCQRIAHGHRSKLEIYQDGTRNTPLEKQWCQLWQDIYIGTREDSQDEGDCYRFEYQTAQGRFMLRLPKDDCYLMDKDTTVELIAMHIADTLKRRHPESHFLVKAYEGVKKGAIASR